jgi:hypothetical protein
MLERSRVWSRASKALAAAGAAAMLLSGCATTAPEEPVPRAAAAPSPSPVAERPKADPHALAEEARALVAQAETDIQRARARRALWSKAWEALVGARASLAQNDAAGAIRQARRASELAQLGLEQLAYPATKHASRSSP